MASQVRINRTQNARSTKTRVKWNVNHDTMINDYLCNTVSAQTQVAIKFPLSEEEEQKEALKQRGLKAIYVNGKRLEIVHNNQGQSKKVNNKFIKYKPYKKKAKISTLQKKIASPKDVINSIPRKEHLRLFNKIHHNSQSKSYWLRQLSIRFYNCQLHKLVSLQPIIEKKKTEHNIRKIHNGRISKKLKWWLKVALTPLKLNAWQRVTVCSMLGFGAVFSISLLFMTSGTATVSQQTSPLQVYEVIYNHKVIGTTANKAGTFMLYKGKEKELEQQLGMEVELTYPLEFNKVDINPEVIDSGQKALSNINELAYKVYAVEIELDGKTVGLVNDKKTAQKVIDTLIEPFSQPNKRAIEFNVVGIKEQIAFKEVTAQKEDLLSVEQITKPLMQAEQEKQVHIVESGESVSGIAQKYDLKVAELMAINPEIGDDYRISIGQELAVVQPVYQYTVLTEETVQFDQTLEYETEYIKDSNLYTTQTKTIKAGVLGEVQTTAKLHKENGVIVEETILSEEVLKEPVTEVLRVGTKEPAMFIESSTGTGKFVWPTTGAISSEFGPRWGRMHSGIDFANASGTPIYAADSGTVTYSAYNSGGYGNLVKIYHGNGIETRYGHMVKRAVKEGAQVEKGQLIGYMGNTGRSTGSHLHFEVRVGGVAQNPRNFLN